MPTERTTPGGYLGDGQMSGSQGRFPPAVPPPQSQWRPEGDVTRPPQQQGAPRWPVQPLSQHQQPPFPPQYQPQPPAVPAQPAHGLGYGQANPQAAPNDAGGPAYGWPPGQHQHSGATQPPQVPGYGHQPLAQPQRPGIDPAAYDLGSYSLPSGHTAAPQPGLRSGRPPQPPREAGQQQWSPQPVDPYPYQPPQTAAPPPAPQGYGYLPPQSAGVPADPREHDAAYDEEVEYEDAPPRRRRWLVAAALIGSVGLGGGMAYVYKTVLAPRGGDSAQVVKAPRDPARVPPTERGGKQLPNATNNTVMNRVPPEGTVAAAGGTTDSTGVRRVSTVPVDRNLAPMPPAPPSAPTGVPGMIVVGAGNNPGMPPPMPPSMPAPSFEQPARAAAPAQAQPRVAAAPTPPPPPARPPPQRAPAPEAAEPPPVRQAATAPAQPAAPRTRPAGYVAVLGYQRSQMEAMRMMADLQQKYEALRDKKLEIVQSDQTARGLGVIYRVVVGPPGSIAPAKEVCQQLYQAGMRQSGCYPLASN